MTPETAGHSGMIIQTGLKAYQVAGQAITVAFRPASGERQIQRVKLYRYR